jgi:hypothetical protein
VRPFGKTYAKVEGSVPKAKVRGLAPPPVRLDSRAAMAEVVQTKIYGRAIEALQ